MKSIPVGAASAIGWSQKAAFKKEWLTGSTEDGKWAARVGSEGLVLVYRVWGGGVGGVGRVW